MEELLAEILEELKIELCDAIDGDSDLAILSVKLKNAFREVESAINFKAHHDEEYRLNEIRRYIGNIKSVATYDYMIIGAEGEKSHDENGINRTYKSRSDCFNGIVRYADI